MRERSEHTDTDRSAVLPSTFHILRGGGPGGGGGGGGGHVHLVPVYLHLVPVLYLYHVPYTWPTPARALEGWPTWVRVRVPGRITIPIRSDRIEQSSFFFNNLQDDHLQGQIIR